MTFRAPPCMYPTILTNRHEIIRSIYFHAHCDCIYCHFITQSTDALQRALCLRESKSVRLHTHRRYVVMVDSYYKWHAGVTSGDVSPIKVQSVLIACDHWNRSTAVGRTPLYEWSARPRDLYLTTHNTHNRQTSMPPAGFETAVVRWLPGYY